MKLILITAAALAMLTTTALADRPTPTEIAEFEAKAYDRVEPPQKIVAIHRGIRASVAFFSTDDKDYVAVPPGTVMSIVMRDKTTPTANCVLLPDTVTKGLRPRSPSGCFWTILE